MTGRKMERVRRTKVGEGVLELVDELDEVHVHGGQRGWEVVAAVREVVERMVSASKSSRHNSSSRRQTSVITRQLPHWRLRATANPSITSHFTAYSPNL